VDTQLLFNISSPPQMTDVNPNSEKAGDTELLY